jgi:hypothetical protein
MRIGVMVKTFCGAGRFQHTPTFSGKDSVSNEVVEMLRRVNERLYDEMPKGADDLRIEISYKVPRRQAPPSRTDTPSSASGAGPGGEYYAEG